MASSNLPIDQAKVPTTLRAYVKEVYSPTVSPRRAVKCQQAVRRFIRFLLRNPLTSEVTLRQLQGFKRWAARNGCTPRSAAEYEGRVRCVVRHAHPDLLPRRVPGRSKPRKKSRRHCYYMRGYLEQVYLVE